MLARLSLEGYPVRFFQKAKCYDFVNWVKDTFLLARNDEKEIPQLKRLKPKVSLKSILQTVSDESRSLAIYLARDLSGITCSKLGDYFGGVSGAAITVRYNKVAEEMARDKRLKRKVSKIKSRIINI